MTRGACTGIAPAATISQGAVAGAGKLTSILVDVARVGLDVGGDLGRQRR
jgi:hypothetical protein